MGCAVVEEYARAMLVAIALLGERPRNEYVEMSVAIPVNEMDIGDAVFGAESTLYRGAVHPLEAAPAADGIEFELSH